MSNYTDFISIYTFSLFVCKRLHSNKVCLCCFLDIHLYSNSLSIIATNSSLIMSDLFPACCSWSKKFNLLQSSLEEMVKSRLKFPKP